MNDYDTLNAARPAPIILRQLELETMDALWEERRRHVRTALEELRARYKEHPEEFGSSEMRLIRDYKLWTGLLTEADRKREEGEARRQERERRIAAHRGYMAWLGVEYKGVREPTQPRRITHCYQCRRPLDSEVDLECAACAWILCSCGACGCGYQGLS
jgi:hypothetical protein